MTAPVLDPVVPAALPQRRVWVRPPTTLYHVAARELGDATQWYRIAELNGTGSDPWLVAPAQLLIPQPGTSNGGVPSS